MSAVIGLDLPLPGLLYLVGIQHTGGSTLLHAHNLENPVEVADAGEMRAVIGIGHATASIRHHGMTYNPLHLLEAREAPILARAPAATLDDNEDRE